MPAYPIYTFANTQRIPEYLAPIVPTQQFLAHSVQ